MCKLLKVCLVGSPLTEKDCVEELYWLEISTTTQKGGYSCSFLTLAQWRSSWDASQ